MRPRELIITSTLHGTPQVPAAASELGCLAEGLDNSRNDWLLSSAIHNEMENALNFMYFVSSNPPTPPPPIRKELKLLPTVPQRQKRSLEGWKECRNRRQAGPLQGNDTLWAGGLRAVSEGKGGQSLNSVCVYFLADASMHTHLLRQFISVGTRTQQTFAGHNSLYGTPSSSSGRFLFQSSRNPFICRVPHPTPYLAVPGMVCCPQ